jgi:hypothetical protein
VWRHYGTMSTPDGADQIPSSSALGTSYPPARPLTAWWRCSSSTRTSHQVGDQLTVAATVTRVQPSILSGPQIRQAAAKVYQRSDTCWADAADRHAGATCDFGVHRGMFGEERVDDCAGTIRERGGRRAHTSSYLRADHGFLRCGIRRANPGDLDRRCALEAAVADERKAFGSTPSVRVGARLLESWRLQRLVGWRVRSPPRSTPTGADATLPLLVDRR